MDTSAGRGKAGDGRKAAKPVPPSRRGDREAFKLAALRDFTLGVTRARDFDESLRLALMVILGTFAVGKGVLFLEEGGEFRARVSRGLPPGIPPVERTRELMATLRAARRPARIGVRGAAAAVHRIASQVEKAVPAFSVETFCPLGSKKGPVGFLLLGPTLAGGELAQRQRDTLGVMASFLGNAISNHQVVLEISQLNELLRVQLQENARLLQGMQEIYLDTIRALAAAIEAKDPYTHGHSERVAKLSVAIAREMRLPEADVQAIHVASILHDIGKIATDRVILSKSTPLSRGEIREIQRHPLTSYDILSEIRFPYPGIAAMARHHHERLDGSGYPDGKRDHQIPMGARIIAIADAFDAMVSNRPYRDGLPGLHALAEIRDNLRSQFDPTVARSFFRLLRRDMANGGDLADEFFLTDISTAPRDGGGRKRVFDSIDRALAELP